MTGVNRCTAVQFDDFERTVASGWGDATPSGVTSMGSNLTTIAVLQLSVGQCILLGWKLIQSWNTWRIGRWLYSLIQSVDGWPRSAGMVLQMRAFLLSRGW